MAKIVIAMSGGVDSSVSAYLLKSQGHEVIGIFMRNWDSMANNDILGNPHLNSLMCPEEKDYQDALMVANQLGIKLLRVDFIDQYYKLVFENLIKEYSLGRTPNPDILCNKYIKFGMLLQYIEKNVPDYDYVATGHYAKTNHGLLYKPLDNTKDQTYFLAQLNQSQLSKVIFPLANLTKKAVRAIAQSQNLYTADKKDSMGICFIGKRKFQDFLKNYIPAQPGKIVDIKTQQVVGTHEGAMYYTIGQRRGLKIDGQSTPYYLAGRDLAAKIIYVANDLNSEYLISNQAIITDVNWIKPGYQAQNLTVRFRYKSVEVPAQMRWENNNIIITYNNYSGVTPGQQCVFYDGELCLGGGVIDKIFLDGKPKQFV